MARDNGYDYLFPRATMIEHHLRYNHYPPITSPNAVDIAIQAIELVEQGKDDAPVEINAKGSSVIVYAGAPDEPATAAEIVEGWHLGDFIDNTEGS